MQWDGYSNLGLFNLRHLIGFDSLILFTYWHNFNRLLFTKFFIVSYWVRFLQQRNIHIHSIRISNEMIIDVIAFIFYRIEKEFAINWFFCISLTLWKWEHWKMKYELIGPFTLCINSIFVFCFFFFFQSYMNMVVVETQPVMYLKNVWLH